jgi:hypothetical protein
MTILIAARNAEETIERAVASCARETKCRLLLVDDHCTDRTVVRARSAAGGRLRVVPAPDPGGVGAARQCGLDAVDTEFAAWLDADDEWIPGRAERLTESLRAGHDVAIDAFDLHDGASGGRLRRLTPPAFLRTPGGAVRLFERNWLPGDTPVGFRVETFRRAGGYDPAIYGPESYDLLLRTLAQGAKFSWSDDLGYRIYAYPGSVSRNVARQRASVAAALRKHEYDEIATLFARAGYAPRVTAWALVSVALFRDEPVAALQFLGEASPPEADAAQVLEPEGPWPYPEGWRRAFAVGVIMLLLGGYDDVAIEALRKAEALQPAPETANNLGVALARSGHVKEACACFSRALALFPGYADAACNLAAPSPDRVTTHPLRHAAHRLECAGPAWSLH